MKIEEIIEMARQAGFPFNKYGLLQGDAEGEIDADAMFVAFAKLVADVATAKEREACAKVAICYDSEPWKHTPAYSHVADMVSVEIGKAIRARGEA